MSKKPPPLQIRNGGLSAQMGQESFRGLPSLASSRSTKALIGDWVAANLSPDKVPNLQMRLWGMQAEYRMARQRSAQGLEVTQPRQDQVDVSGRQKAITKFEGRKVRGSQQEGVRAMEQRMLALNSARSLPDTGLRSQRTVRAAAEIQTWKLNRGASHRRPDVTSPLWRALHANTMSSPRRPTKEDDDDEHLFLSQLISTSADRSFKTGMLDPQNISTVETQSTFEGSQELIDALQMPPKERQYEQLEHIIAYMDTITEEPFVSMSEFEKLKAAMLCEVSTAAHGTAIVKCQEAPQNLFVLIQGRVAVFDFRVALNKFRHEYRVALQNVRNQAAEDGKPLEIDSFQEEWNEKRHQYFDQTWRLVDQAEAGSLPSGTRHEQRLPGYVYGHDVLAPEEYFAQDGSQSMTVVSTCERGSQSIFLVMNKAVCEEVADVVNKDWAEKAQLLRTAQLTSGVSKLGIKMLAMQARLQYVAPNTVIVPQGSSPSQIYVVQRGFVRMVKKMMPEAPAKPPRLRESASSPPREQRAQIEKEKSRCDSLQGKFIEMGLLGITQSFGAVSVLEVGNSHPLCVIPANIISCRRCTLLTLSRNNMLKISHEDRENMLQNARTHEDFDKSNAQIASELERGEQWTAYKNSILENVVADKNKRKAYGLGMYVNGPSSAVTVRSHKPDPQPDLDTYELQPHPFSNLGSVAIGLY